MTTIITTDEYLTVNSTPLATPAWRVTSLAPLHDDPTLRGEDVVIDGADGVRPYQRTITVTVLTFGLVIFGHVNEEGTLYSNPRMGLITNRETLAEGLGLADHSSGAGTVTAVWTRPDTSTATALVHVLGLKGAARVGNMLRTTLDLSIPGGRFVVDGP